MTLTTITTRVTLNGSQVGAHEVSWKAAISNDLPARFSSGDTVPMRTGKIRWANSKGIAQWVSPLSPYYPKPGDTVVIETTVRTPTVTRIATEFTGVIDTTTGGMHEPLESTIIDHSDALRRSISRDPLIQRMPSRQGTENNPRWAGLQYSYALYEAAKKCGFGVQYSEKAGAYCLDLSLAGSLWADRSYGPAELIAGGRDNSFSNPPLFATLSGNRGLGIGAASWVNSAARNLGANGFYTEFDLFSPGATPTMRLEFRFENGGYMGFRIEQRNIQISIDGATWETICPVPSSSAVLGFFYPARAGEKIQVRVDDEYFVAQTARASASARLLPDPVSEKVTPTNSPIFLSKSGTGIVANLLVGLMTSTRNTETWWKRIVRSRRAAKIFMDLDGNIPPLEYHNAVEAVPAIETIAEITEKLCISCWFDGNGVLHFESGVDLRRRPSVLSIGPEVYQPILWESEHRHAASSITIKGKTPVIQMSWGGSPIITVWSGGSSETFLDREEITHFISIDDDKDYFEIDTTPVNLNARYDAVKDIGGQPLTDERWSKHWRGHGSVFAVKRNNQNPVQGQDFDDSIPGYKVYCFIEKIAVKTLKVTLGYREGQHIPYSVPGIPDVVAQKMYLPDGSDGMPIVRAGASVELTDASPLTWSNQGPYGPELLHDMGIFFSAAEYMGGMLNDYFSTRHPYIKNFVTRYDTRITPGACITIDAKEKWGITLKALVTAVEANPAQGTMTVTPRIVSFTESAPAQTYADVESAYSDYAALEELNYNQIGA